MHCRSTAAFVELVQPVLNLHANLPDASKRLCKSNGRNTSFTRRQRGTQGVGATNKHHSRSCKQPSGIVATPLSHPADFYKWPSVSYSVVLVSRRHAGAFCALARRTARCWTMCWTSQTRQHSVYPLVSQMLRFWCQGMPRLTKSGSPIPLYRCRARRRLCRSTQAKMMQWRSLQVKALVPT
jgi:hypothetical protein